MSDVPRPTAPRALFWAFCAFFVLIAGGYVIRSGDSTNVPSGGDVSGPPFVENLSSAGTSPGLLFASTAFDRTNGHVVFEMLGQSPAPQSLTRLRCERVHFSNGVGICLSADRGFLTTFSANVFGEDFRFRSTVPLPGPPSRARVSPNGRRAAMTVFVSGDSYASTSFSTRTTLVDTETGRVLADLEEFAVSRSGAPFKAVDFNFWGVTFARDSNRFFATLRTAGTNYLVEGDIDKRSAAVIHEGVECPSLSPDEAAIVFKKRVGPAQWRLHLLDVATRRDTPLAETRSVDDQPEWLDAETIAYGLPASQHGSARGSNIWTLNVRNDAPATLLIPNAHSPATVR